MVPQNGAGEHATKAEEQQQPPEPRVQVARRRRGRLFRHGDWRCGCGSRGPWRRGQRETCGGIFNVVLAKPLDELALPRVRVIELYAFGRERIRHAVRRLEVIGGVLDPTARLNIHLPELAPDFRKAHVQARLVRVEAISAHKVHVPLAEHAAKAIDLDAAPVLQDPECPMLQTLRRCHFPPTIRAASPTVDSKTMVAQFLVVELPSWTLRIFFALLATSAARKVDPLHVVADPCPTRRGVFEHSEIARHEMAIEVPWPTLRHHRLVACRPSPHRLLRGVGGPKRGFMLSTSCRDIVAKAWA
mmetsp:Transcript_119028/g.336634  ORF Transcript_119028/g.336634 Transcript_119028/m.336634 type:complete len:302 (-) Transcript_119028:389-1294(-)